MSDQHPPMDPAPRKPVPRLPEGLRLVSVTPQPPSQTADMDAPEFPVGRAAPELDVRKNFAEFAAFQAKKRNLTASQKVVFFVGRGKTGKTTVVRYLAGAMLRKNASIVVLDADTTNPALHQYLKSAITPPDYHGDAVVSWILEQALAAITSKVHILIDLGGGDNNLSELLAAMPNFVSTIEEIGGAVIMASTFGISSDDLSPIANLHNAGFRPSGSILLFNEASLGRAALRSSSFRQIQSHSLYKRLIDTTDAVPILLPSLKVAEEVEARRLDFESAFAGRAPAGIQPLSISQRFLLGEWMSRMSAAFEPVSAWFE